MTRRQDPLAVSIEDLLAARRTLFFCLRDPACADAQIGQAMDAEALALSAWIEQVVARAIDQPGYGSRFYTQVTNQIELLLREMRLRETTETQTQQQLTDLDGRVAALERAVGQPIQEP